MKEVIEELTGYELADTIEILIERYASLKKDNEQLVRDRNYYRQYLEAQIKHCNTLEKRIIKLKKQLGKC